MLTPAEELRKWLKATMGQAKPGQEFPRDKELAQKFMVSELTVRSAFKEFKLRGEVLRIRGRGTFKTGPQEKESVTLKKQPNLLSHEVVADTLADQIAKGVLEIGAAMPSIAYIVANYHVAPRTVILAYRNLEKKKLISRMGLSYRVGKMESHLSGTNSGRILVLRADNADVHNFFSKDPMARAYERMERLLLGAGRRIRYARLDEVLERPGLKLNDNTQISGIIFAGLSDTYFHEKEKQIISLAKQLDAAKVPLLIDWTRGYSGNILPKFSTLLSRGHLLTSLCRELADYLIRKHIKAVTFFFDENIGKDYPWGIVALLRSWAEIKRVNPKLRIDFAFRSKFENDELPVFLSRLTNAVGENFISSELSRNISPYTVSTEILLNSGCLYDTLDTVFKNCPHFWVFMTASEAANACEWALKKGISLPRQVAILSLQDDLQQRSWGITACEPDWDLLAYLMAHALMRDIPVAKSSKGFLAGKALVLERDTTT